MSVPPEEDSLDRELANADEAAEPAAPARIDSKDWLNATAAAVGFYLIALWRLGFPNQQIFDEVYHARSGMEYVLGLDPHEWTHPPLAKLLIGLSEIVFRVRFDPRDGKWLEKAHYSMHYSFAWRYPSLLFAVGSLILIYMIARVMFKRRDIALLAACLLAFDGVFFVQARMAMTNMFTVFFVLLATLGTYLFCERANYKYLFVTGLGLGLALATRWTTLFVWGLTGIALLGHLFTILIPRWRKEADRGEIYSVVPPLFGWIGIMAATMVVIPAAIYAVAYIPNVLQGPGDWHAKLLTWNGTGTDNSWSYILGVKDGLQHRMWAYHSGIKDKHPFSSPWWTWPLMLRPVAYYNETNAQHRHMEIWSIGNGLIWWASVPAFLAAIVLAWREKRAALGLIALLGLGQWLFWGIEPRSLIFMHYYFESIPYACLAIAFLLVRLWEIPAARKNPIVGKISHAAVIFYCTAVVVWFAFYYPVLSGYPISDSYESHLSLWNDLPWL